MTIYRHPAPKKGRPGRTIWYATIYIGGNRHTMSLQLEGTDTNEKHARHRATRLEAEARAGKLSLTSRNWLGPKSAKRVQGWIAQAQAEAPPPPLLSTRSQEECPWIRVRLDSLHCSRCDARESFPEDGGAADLVAAIRDFVDRHGHCPEGPG